MKSYSTDYFEFLIFYGDCRVGLNLNLKNLKQASLKKQKKS